MISVVIAIDPNTKENGCLQLLKGSNQMGRLTHEVKGEQLVADEERVEAIKV
jgi:ectoine hydroxylase-related dioxygenase (phytanoyl-CoA dioxygenase family)